jgi:hypothetical protein
VKRYLLFVYPRFYPSGGWHDFEGSFDSIAGALAHVPNVWLVSADSLVHVVDAQTGQIVHGQDTGA